MGKFGCRDRHAQREDGGHVKTQTQGECHIKMELQGGMYKSRTNKDGEELESIKEGLSYRSRGSAALMTL